MNKIMAKLVSVLIVLSCVQSNAATMAIGTSQYELANPIAIGVNKYMRSTTAQGELEYERYYREMNIHSKAGMDIRLRYFDSYDYYGERNGFTGHYSSRGSVLVYIVLLDAGVGQEKFDLAVSDSELIYEIYGADKNKPLDVLGHYKLSGNITISCESDKKCTALYDI